MDNNNHELGNQNITKLLIKFSTPAIIGMVTNALYNLVDTIVLGRGVGTLAIAGLAIGFPIQMISLAIGQTVGIGAASIISRSLGAGNYEKAYKTAGNSFLTSIALGIIMLVLGLIFIKPLLLLFGATDTILPYADEYMRIIFLGSPFFIFAVSSNNIARSEGSPMIAMTSMMIGAILNIILDPIFVFIYGWGIAGAAYATIISQFVSFVFLAAYFLSKKNILRIKVKHLYPDIKILFETFAVGSASFARQATGSILAIILNNSLKVYGGDLYIAIFGVINRVMMFMFMPVFGIVQGLQPIIGFNFGARKMQRVKRAMFEATIVITIMMTLGFLIMQIFPSFVLSVFSKDTLLIQKGAPIMRIVLAMIPIIGIQIVGATYYQAVGKSLEAMFFSMARQVIFFIPLILTIPIFLRLTGVWLSFPIADLLSTILTVVWLMKEFKMLTEVEA